jgi:tripartite-type tricarboxylate transporter receptor subunit TctC
VPGLQDFEVVSWQAIFVPAGTPAPVVDRLHTEIRKILSAPEMQDKLKSFGMEPADLSTAQIAAFQKAEVEKWAQVIKAAGIKAD